jgi:hypothetical protein
MQLLSPILFALDAVSVLAAAWLAVRLLGGDKHGRLGLALSWGMLAVMLVVAAGLLLGALSGLGQPGFLVVHGLTLAVLALVRRSWLGHDRDALREFFRAGLRSLRVPGPEGWLLGLLVAAGTVTLVFACSASPVVFDALTYRLSRVGQWLQDGRIGLIATDDARLNYMPVAPDLMMAWLLTAQTDGFNVAAVAQTVGGWLALGATAGLARLMGLSRSSSLAAALLLLGLPNVAPQFTSAYTDLFTTGVLATAVYLWLAALRRGEGSWLGGAGAGLALGAKGTVVYFAPGLLLAVAWLAWRHRIGWPAWTKTLLGGLLAVAIFVMPWLLRNQRAYGGWAGPAGFVAWHHGDNPGWKGSVDKLKLNLTSALAQLCEPNSQPPWWRKAVRATGEAVIDHLPEQDAYAFDDLNRRANLKKIYAVDAPDADVASTGVLLPLLGLLAGLTALLGRRTAGSELVLAWAVALIGFVLFMHWRVQWNPYQFRFLVLAAPWLAVLVVWWLARLPRWPRVVAWTVLAATSAHGFGAAMLDTYQSGWPAYARPGQSFGYHVYDHWRAWASRLDQPDQPLRPALPMNLPLAAFYRQRPARPVEPAQLSALTATSAEDAAPSGTGWIIVPADLFMGREGKVMGRTRLHEGDAKNAFSLAAYRALRDGEQPVPLLYRNRLVETPAHRRHELLVRTWGAQPVRLELANTGGAICRFVLRSPAGRLENEVRPGMRLWLEISLPADALSPIVLEYPGSSPGEAVSARLEASLVP